MVLEIYKTICTVLVAVVVGIGVILWLVMAVVGMIDTVKEDVLAKKRKRVRCIYVRNAGRSQNTAYIED